VFDNPPSWRKALAREIIKEFFEYFYSYLMATRIISVAMIIASAKCAV
jgi:hypothetical protein